MYTHHHEFAQRLIGIESAGSALKMIKTELDLVSSKEDLNSLMESLEYIKTIDCDSDTAKHAASVFITMINKNMNSYIPRDKPLNESFSEMIYSDNSIPDPLANRQISSSNFYEQNKNARSSLEPKEYVRPALPTRTYHISEKAIASRKAIDNLKIVNEMTSKLKSAILAEIALLSIPFGEEYLDSIYESTMIDLTNLIHNKGRLVSTSYEIDSLFESVRDHIPFDKETLFTIFREDCTLKPFEFRGLLIRHQPVRAKIVDIANKFENKLVEYFTNKANNHALYEEVLEECTAANSIDLNQSSIKKLKKLTENKIFDEISKSVSNRLQNCNEEVLTVESIKLYSITTVLKTLDVI